MPRTTRVAISGFGPFPGVPRNPSAEIVCAVGRMRRFPAAGIVLDSAIFPTIYAEARVMLQALIDKKPDAIVMFGVAGKAKHIRIETIARNAASTLHPDHARATPASRKLTEAGAADFKSRAPAARLRAAARAAGVKAEFSNDAGRYLCNAVFYQALAATAALSPPPLVQFVHVPAVKTRAGLLALIRAGEAIVWAAAQEAARRSGSGRLTRPGS
jgi:pyroglutamyl-peptidase